MAVKYTLICDGCGEGICSTMHSERHTRAAAQMECGANCNRDGDYCQSCRLERARLTDAEREAAASRGHSISSGTAPTEPLPPVGGRL